MTAPGHQVCAYCGAGVRLPAAACWMCGRPLVVRQAAASEKVREDNDPTWILVVVIVALMLLVVAVAIGFEAPGFLIPYAVLALPIVAALAIIAFKRRLPTFGPDPSKQIQTTSQADAGQSARAAQPVARGSGTADTVAKALLAVLLVLCAVVALALVAFVLFAIVCIGIIAASTSGGHF